VHALLILVATMLAFPAPWGRRLLGIAVGTLAVLGCNVVRLVTLIVVARYFPARLEQFHIYIWQPLIALIAFALFFVWATCFTLSGPKSATTGDAT